MTRLKKELPYKTWKKYRNRLNKRSHSKNFFNNNFKIKTKEEIIVGNVYAIRYNALENILTDKHHVLCVILSFGNFIDENGRINTRALNLFYMPLLESVYNLSYASFYRDYDIRNKILMNIEHHDYIMNGYSYAIKNFVDDRILSCVEIEYEKWGTIPLLNKEMFGIFSDIHIKKDYKKETTPKTIFKPKIKDKPKIDVEQETISFPLYEINFSDDI